MAEAVMAIEADRQVVGTLPLTARLLTRDGRPARPDQTFRLRYAVVTLRMKTLNSVPVVDRLVAPLGDCLTPESARRLLALKPDPDLQRQVDDMASRHTEGKLSQEEQAEYGCYVSYATFIAILKSKARQVLAASGGE